MDMEIKTLLEEQAKTFEAFKSANDEMEKQLKDLKAADTVTAEKVEKINKALDDVADKIKSATKANEDLELKMGRLSIASEGDKDEVKAAADFGLLIRRQVSVDEFRAYKTGFNAYMRRSEQGLSAEDLKALSVGSDPAGGYLVRPDISGRIVQKIYESSPIRQLAFVQTIGTDALEGIIDNGEADAAWVGETGTRAETTTPTLGKWQIEANELYAYPKATMKLLEDASVDMEAWLASKVGDKFGRKEATAFISGTGINQPKGILSYTNVTTADATRAWGQLQYIATGVSGDFAASNKADKILDLIYSLKTAYRTGASFLMSRATAGAVRKIKDGQGNYLWQPSAQAGQPAQLFNFPVAEGEDMPAIAADSMSIVFGNFREAYTIVDRLGISVIRDNVTTPGFVKFATRRRVGGGMTNFEALKLLKFGTS